MSTLYFSTKWLPPYFSRFKRTNKSGIIYDAMNWFALISWCKFLEQLKNCFILHHQAWSGNTSLNKGTFLNLFCNLRSDWSLVPGPFCSSGSCQLNGTTISFILFWDFSMFYQIFLSPPVKQWTIITYKHGMYELPHKLPNNLRLRI